MRFIKPCSRLRGMRFGCHVRFIEPFFLLHLGFLVDYSCYPYNLSIMEAEGRVICHIYASLKRKSTRPSLISSLSCRGVGVLAVSFCRFKNVKLVLFSSSSMYWPFSTKMRACIRETPPSSPPCGVRSTSGKMLLTASSRPIITLSLPPKSNSWLSASTISRALNAAGAEDITGAAVTGGAVTAGATFAASVVPSIAPQFEQNDSPAGLSDPQDGQTSLPTGADAPDGAG